MTTTMTKTRLNCFKDKSLVERNSIFDKIYFVAIIVFLAGIAGFAIGAVSRWDWGAAVYPLIYECFFGLIYWLDWREVKEEDEIGERLSKTDISVQYRQS